jgi:hypothetical protein
LISPDYRLAPQADIYSILEDATSAVEYVRTHLSVLVGHKIDPTRLALSGGSAGGWLGAHLVKVIAEFSSIGWYTIWYDWLFDLSADLYSSIVPHGGRRYAILHNPTTASAMDERLVSSRCLTPADS